MNGVVENAMLEGECDTPTLTGERPSLALEEAGRAPTEANNVSSLVNRHNWSFKSVNSLLEGREITGLTDFVGDISLDSSPFDST